jgi:cellulose synthase/poly-beta-1,6-N-acetylglucosamine synthase-like glycosyltransferase
LRDAAPRIDVIIAARNEEALLGSCLDSLLSQDYPREKVRITVVDNASTDRTAEIAACYPVELRHEAKPGAAAARNRALEESDAELIALLDAHCVLNSEWLVRMAGHFEDDAVGGCQARIDNRASDPRLQRYLTRSGMLTNDRALDDTVRGELNIYPWILSGNSMYRRSAVQTAGGFDESLAACEDVDLAWRVVLLGYRLEYEDAAVAVHYNSDRWLGYVTKLTRYGDGAAVLARRYLAHGARNAFKPASLWSADIERTLSAFFYWAGYRAKAMRIALGTVDVSGPTVPERAIASLRPPFDWSSSARLRISDQVVYWFRDDDASVIVHRPSRSRVVLDGAGDFIWRRLADGRSRGETIARLVATYGISDVTAGADADDLIDELLDAGILLALNTEREPARL